MNQEDRMSVSPQRPQDANRRPLLRRPSRDAETPLQSSPAPPRLFQLRNLTPTPDIQDDSDDAGAQEEPATDEGTLDLSARIESATGKVNAAVESGFAEAKESFSYSKILAGIAVVGFLGYAASWAVSNAVYIPTGTNASATKVADVRLGAADTLPQMNAGQIGMQAPSFESPTADVPFPEFDSPSIESPAFESPDVQFPNVETPHIQAPRFTDTGVPEIPTDVVDVAVDPAVPDVIVDLAEPTANESIGTHEFDAMANAAENLTAPMIDTTISAPSRDKSLSDSGDTLGSLAQSAKEQVTAAKDAIADPISKTVDAAATDLDALADQIGQLDSLKTEKPMDTVADIKQPLLAAQSSDPNQTEAQLISGQPSAFQSHATTEPINVLSNTPTAPQFAPQTQVPAAEADLSGSYRQTASPAAPNISTQNIMEPTIRSVASPVPRTPAPVKTGPVDSRTPNPVLDWSRYLPPAR